MLLLNAEGLLSLQTHLEVRQLFVSLKKQAERIILQLPPQQQQNTLSTLIQQLFTQGSIQLAEGLKNLIAFILAENEEQADVLSSIGETCVHFPFK